MWSKVGTFFPLSILFGHNVIGLICTVLESSYSKLLPKTAKLTGDVYEDFLGKLAQAKMIEAKVVDVTNEAG